MTFAVVAFVDVRGPLAWLWARILGRRAAAALPASQHAIADLAAVDPGSAAPPLSTP